VARNAFRILDGKPVGSVHLEDCEDGNTILRWISWKCVTRVGDRTGLRLHPWEATDSAELAGSTTS
jgi:hypothetical protein